MGVIHRVTVGVAALLAAGAAAAAQSCTLPINLLAKDKTPLTTASASSLVVAKPKGATVIALVPAPPVRVLLLLDGSGSMGMEKRWPAAEAEAVAVLQAAPAGVAVGVAAFEDKLTWMADYRAPATNLVPGLVSAFAQHTPRGGTAFYDAIVESLERPDGLGPGDTLVVVSDGEDDASRVNGDQAVEQLQRHGVRMFLLGFENEAGGIAPPGKKLAEASGGATRDISPRRGAPSAASDAGWLWDLLQDQHMATIRYAGGAGAELKLKPATQAAMGGILYPRSLRGCGTRAAEPALGAQPGMAVLPRPRG